MKIKDIVANIGRINIIAQIESISEIKEFSRFGKTGKVASAIIKDDSGEIKLTLWDEQTEEFKEGDKIEIQNGYSKEWQGELQLSVGRYGKLEKITN